MKAIKTIGITLLCLILAVSLCALSAAAAGYYTAISPAVPINATGSYRLATDAEFSQAGLVASGTITAPSAGYTFSQISIDEPDDYTYYLELTDDAGNADVYKIIFHVTTKAKEGGNDELVAEVVVSLGEEKIPIKNYHLILLKIDPDQGNKPLAGAEFALYRDSDVENGKVKTDDEGNPAAPLVEGATASDGKIDLGALNAGVYWLIETKAPEGYVRRLPMKLEITSTGVTLQGCDVVAIAADGTIIQENVPEGQRDYQLVVTNTAGTVLPGTGGSGTVVFYVLGAVLLVTAAALAVIRKKKG